MVIDAGERSRILHLVAPGTPGGGGTTVRLLGDLMPRWRSIESTVIVFGNAGHARLARSCRVTPTVTISPPLQQPLLSVASLRRVIRRMEQEHGRVFDLVHAWSPAAALAARRAAPGRPLLMTLALGPRVDAITGLLVHEHRRRPFPAVTLSPAVGAEWAVAGLDPDWIVNVEPGVDPDGIRERNLGPGAADVGGPAPAAWSGFNAGRATEAGDTDATDTDEADQHQHGRRDRDDDDLGAPAGSTRRSSARSYPALRIALIGEPVRSANLRHAVDVVSRVRITGRRVTLVVHPGLKDVDRARRWIGGLGRSDLLTTDERIATPWRLAGAAEIALFTSSRTSARNLVPHGRPSRITRFLDPSGQLDGTPGVLSLLWAMSLGLAVVAEDSDAYRSIVREGTTGLLVPPGDANLASDRIIRLHNDRTLGHRLAASAMQYTAHASSIGRCSGHLLAIYELLGGLPLGQMTTEFVDSLRSPTEIEPGDDDDVDHSTIRVRRRAIERDPDDDPAAKRPPRQRDS